MPWRIVVDVDAQEVLRYPTTFPEQFTDQYPLDVYTHLYVENLVDPDSVKPTKTDDGSVTLVPNVEWYWSQLRTERNARLAASDYTQLQDAHISQDKKDAWAAYRQALRDLPDELGAEGSGPPDLFDWPLKPGELPPVVPVASSRFGALLEQAGVEPVPEVQEVPEPVVESEPVPEVQEVVEVPVVEEVPEVQEVVEVPEPVVESEPVVEVPVVEPVVEVPEVQEVQEVPEVPEPVVEVPEVPEVQEVVEVPEVPEVQEAEPVVEVPEVPEPVPEVPEVPASEPAPVELAASEPVV